MNFRDSFDELQSVEIVTVSEKQKFDDEEDKRDTDKKEKEKERDAARKLKKDALKGKEVEEGKLYDPTKLPETQMQSLVEDEQDALQASARAEVGDGKEPNKFWVSISNDYLIKNADGDLDGSEEEDAQGGAKMLGVFGSWEQAKAKADDVSLDGDNGPRRVTIEDRQVGTVYERTLIKVVKPTWVEDERDDSRMLKK